MASRFYSRSGRELHPSPALQILQLFFGASDALSQIGGNSTMLPRTGFLDGVAALTAKQLAEHVE